MYICSKDKSNIDSRASGCHSPYYKPTKICNTYRFTSLRKRQLNDSRENGKRLLRERQLNTERRTTAGRTVNES